jgi:hypothetical protein
VHFHYDWIDRRTGTLHRDIHTGYYLKAVQVVRVIIKLFGS